MTRRNILNDFRKTAQKPLIYLFFLEALKSYSPVKLHLNLNCYLVLNKLANEFIQNLANIEIF